MAGGGDSLLLNLLTARAERKDTRVFAHATAETQVAITDTYGSRPVSRATHVHINTQEPGFLEVFPRVASRPPRLLQELEGMLVDRLRLADKAACTSMLLPKERDPRMAANLSLEAHRQVFAAFVQGFSTYTNLLSRFQAEFELALSEGVRCAAENVEVRRRMAEEAARRAAAEQEVRSAILAEEIEYRRAAFATLQETRKRTQQLTKRATAVEKELAELRREEARLRRLVEGRRATGAALQKVAQREQAWASLPTSGVVQALQVGPLSADDEAFLEQEYVASSAQVPRADSPSLVRDQSGGGAGSTRGDARSPERSLDGMQPGHATGDMG